MTGERADQLIGKLEALLDERDDTKQLIEEVRRTTEAHLAAFREENEEFRKEMRDGFSLLSNRMTALESEIRGTGGIVGRALCEQRERSMREALDSAKKECMAEISTVKESHKSLANKCWGIASGVILAIIGAVIALLGAHKG